MSVVANFQETNLLRVHMIGALTCFSSGVIYSWLQTWITFKSYPHLNTKMMCYVRSVLCLIMIITFNLCFWLGPEAMKHFTGSNPRKWRKDQGGYYLHLIASLSEWITAICLDIFIGSFTFDMKRLVMTSPSVLFLTDDISIRSIKVSSSWTVIISFQRSSSINRYHHCHYFKLLLFRCFIFTLIVYRFSHIIIIMFTREKKTKLIYWLLFEIQFFILQLTQS